MRTHPTWWECNWKGCPHKDSIGSENSCNGGTLDSCPIVDGFFSDKDREALHVGRLVLRDDVRLTATHAYFDGRKRGQEIASHSGHLHSQRNPTERGGG